MQSKQMKSLRTFRLTTLFGYSIDFVKNKPVRVPALAIEAAISAGAVFCDEDKDYVAGEEGELKVDAAPLYGFERKQKLLEVCKSIANANKGDDFTATGVPKMRKVEEEAGFEINRAELNEVWREYQQEQIG